MADDANPRVFVGANNPPADLPFEAVRIHMDDLLTEARNWADGAKVESQAQADEISRLIEDLNLAIKAADDERVKEKAPFDQKIAEIQDRYNVWIAPLKNKSPGKLPLAIEALKKTLKPWLDELDRQMRAEAERKRQEAEEAAKKAAEAARAAQPEDLTSREAAEDLISAAAALDADAKRAENARAHAVGGSRALGLKRTWTPVLTDPKAALLHYAATRREEMLQFLQGLAEVDVRQGKRQIPGFEVVEGTKL